MAHADPRIKAPKDASHALLVGEVFGILASARLHVELIDDEDGVHQAAVRIARPSGTYLVIVERE